MAIQLKREMYAISGPYHDETYIIKQEEPTEFSVMYKELKASLDQAPEEFEKKLLTPYIWSSEHNVDDDGYHLRYYFNYHVQAFNEVLYIHHPVQFLEIFNQIKNNAPMFKIFVETLDKTDLTVLAKKWDQKKLHEIENSVDMLQRHHDKLFKENAWNEASRLSELITPLTDILLSTRSVDSNAPQSELDLKHRIEFAATLHSKDEYMGNHRKPSFFASMQTDRQKKIQAIHHLLDSENKLVRNKM